MVPDETTFGRLKAGEAASYEWLVSQYEGPLFRFFVCDHRDYHLAQEQTADTFAELVRSLPTMKGSCHQLRGFVFSIARHMKSRHYRRPRPPKSLSANLVEILDPQPITDAIVAEREQLAVVMDAIGQFESHVREILLLRFVEDTPLDEIAQIVGLPLGTVKSHVHRALTHLKSRFRKSENYS